MSCVFTAPVCLCYLNLKLKSACFTGAFVRLQAYASGCTLVELGAIRIPTTGPSGVAHQATLNLTRSGIYASRTPMPDSPVIQCVFQSSFLHASTSALSNVTLVFLQNVQMCFSILKSLILFCPCWIYSKLLGSEHEWAWSQVQHTYVLCMFACALQSCICMSVRVL